MANETETTIITLTSTNDDVDIEFPDIEDIQDESLQVIVQTLKGFIDRYNSDPAFSDEITDWCIENDYLERGAVNE